MPRPTKFCFLTIALLLSAARLDAQNTESKHESFQESSAGEDADRLRRMQTDAFSQQSAIWGHWGVLDDRYSSWVNHSNRLIPLYTFGITLGELRGRGSPYADPSRLRELYQGSPKSSFNPTATYLDQTDVYRLQQQAVAEGKKHIIVFVFDGTDWPTTRAAAIYQTGRMAYRRGRGSGLLFQDYRGVETDFGFIVTSPRQSGAKFDVNAQAMLDGEREVGGGYDPVRGGSVPWQERSSSDYLIGTNRELPHAVTDSAASATSLFSGIKTYNGAIGVHPDGSPAESIARQLQRERGFAVGLVTSVPISHATPAAAYANNVTRKDYQDISRDLLGLPSSFRRHTPLPGVDVLLGGGHGQEKTTDPLQGNNYMPGNAYIHAVDIQRSALEGGGLYVVAQRTGGRHGRDVLREATDRAIDGGHRLLGLFGVTGGHLPFRTADGGYNPTLDMKGSEAYSEADIHENPTLAELTSSALRLLQDDAEGFWLMVEAGDVDWANHANNLDNSIGAVISGERAFGEVVDWADEGNRWDDTVVIVTSDHGHFLVLDDPAAIAR